MNSYIEYLLQSALISGLFYLGYRLFLRNEHAFVQNRIFLIFGIIAAALIPAIQISVPVNQESINTFWLNEVVVQPEGLVSSVAYGMSSNQIILVIYLSGVFVFSVRLISQILQIMILVRKHGFVRKGNDYVVYLDGDFAPFSVLNMIFINKEGMTEEAYEKVITHERVHIRQRHSFDLVIAEVMTIFQWFNPFIWLLKKAIKTNHEYLADQGVIDEGHSRSSYQDLLINQVFGMQINFLSNNFNHSLIKRRLTMMSTIKKSNKSVWKYLFLLPVTLTIAFFITVSFSKPLMAQDKQAKVQMQESQQEKKTDAPIFTVVEEMPTYKGGKDAMLQYLSSNIKYPEEAKKNGIQGRSFVTFIVEKDGRVSNVSLLRGFNDACDNEAMRVVKTMPAWNPGKQEGKPVRVQFNLPISFKLDNNKETEKEE